MFISRREVLAGSLLGGAFSGAPLEAADGSALEPPPDDAAVAQAIKDLRSELQQARRANPAAEWPHVGNVRQQIGIFLRASNKWPEFVDVGLAVFYSLYDWHIRFGLQPNVTRLPDGKFGLAFMFTTLVLRQEMEAQFVGMAYDKER